MVTKISTSGDRSESSVVVKGLRRWSKGLGEKQGEVGENAAGDGRESKATCLACAPRISPISPEEEWQPDTYSVNFFLSVSEDVIQGQQIHSQCCSVMLSSSF